MHMPERKETLESFCACGARKVILNHERAAAQATWTSAGDTASSQPLRSQLSLTPSSTEPTILMTQLPSWFLLLLPQLTHTVPASTAISENHNDQKRESDWIHRHRPTWTLSLGQAPQTRSSPRLVGSVPLAYVESCFGHKGGLGQPVRVKITTKSNQGRNCGCIISTRSREYHGLVSCSTMQRTILEDTGSKERSPPSQGHLGAFTRVLNYPPVLA